MNPKEAVAYLGVTKDQLQQALRACGFGYVATKHGSPIARGVNAKIEYREESLQVIKFLMKRGLEITAAYRIANMGATVEGLSVSIPMGRDWLDNVQPSTAAVIRTMEENI